MSQASLISFAIPNQAQVVAQNSREAKPKLGYLNLKLPTKAGGMHEVGSIHIRDTVRNRELVEWLKQDKGNLAILQSKLIFDFRIAGEIAEGDHFDL